MNKAPLKYHFPRLLMLIGLSELVFWVVILAAHALIALLKNEPIVSSFYVYQNPNAFWLIFALIPIYLIYLSNLSWKNRILKQTFSPHIQVLLLKVPNLRSSFWRFFILRTALIFIIFALANPQSGKRNIEVEGYAGEFVVAVDISKSMLVRDMSQGQSRLNAAKNGLSNLARSLNGSAMGIVVFAGSAYSYMPMTKDVRVMQNYINKLSNEFISDQGTHLAEAIRVSLASFSNNAGTKLIFVISDGEDHEGGLEEALEEANEQNAVIHIVGLGTANGGPIPESKGGVKKDASGEIIIAKPNFELLRSTAEAAGGSFTAENSAYPKMAQLVQNELNNNLSNMKMQSSMRKSFGNVFAFQAFLLLLVYMVLLHLNFKSKSYE